MKTENTLDEILVSDISEEELLSSNSILAEESEDVSVEESKESEDAPLVEASCKSDMKSTDEESEDDMESDDEESEDDMESDDDITEEVNVQRIKQLAASGLINSKDEMPVILALKAADAGKTLTQKQLKLLSTTASNLISVVTGDTSLLGRVKTTLKKGEDDMSEAVKVNSDEEFMDYAKAVLKKAHGEDYDEAKAAEAAKGMLDKADGDYGAAIGILQSSLGESKDKMKMMKMEDVDTSDISRLVESEESLSEEFKEKATIIFEAAVSKKIAEIKQSLSEDYDNRLAEEVETVKSNLEEKIDAYLTYAVESWVAENKVAIESSLRSRISENFMRSLKTVFEEHYIDVPESKVDLYTQVEKENSSLKEELAQKAEQASALQEEVVKLTRDKIIREASYDLADTETEKLKDLTEDVEYVDEESFRHKVNVIKEHWMIGESTAKEETTNDDSYVSTEVIVEDESSESQALSPEMKSYLAALARVNRASTANLAF